MSVVVVLIVVAVLVAVAAAVVIGRGRHRSTSPEGEVLEAGRPALASRLGRARGQLGGYIASVLSRTGVGSDTWDDLEEALITADLGVAATGELLARLRDQVDRDAITEPAQLIEALKVELKRVLRAVGDDVEIGEGGDPVEAGDRRLRYGAQAPPHPTSSGPGPTAPAPIRSWARRGGTPARLSSTPSSGLRPPGPTWFSPTPRAACTPSAT